MGFVDFVIPLHKNNCIFRTVIEGIVTHYSPNTIYVITLESEIPALEKDSAHWILKSSCIKYIPEETFFVSNYGLHKTDIQLLYNSAEENAEHTREFGWWFQQLLKLGAARQIGSLSTPYIVWDSDLICIDPWELDADEQNGYSFAILQESAKNAWNCDQYAAAISDLTGLTVAEPEVGTFVPHHFVMHISIVNAMLDHIVHHCFSEHMVTSVSATDPPTPSSEWIAHIMRLSHTRYRFSEYKCLATFMQHYYPDDLRYHAYDQFGARGLRYRDSTNILSDIMEECVIVNGGFLYQDFVECFVPIHMHRRPSYIQIEHLQR